MTSDVLPGSELPGGSAQARYEKMVKSWRSTFAMKRVRRVSFSIGTLFLLIGASTGDALASNMGALAGGSFCFWFGIRDLAVPECIERWRRGAEGETATAKELKKLGPEWRVRHDLQGRYGNVDHVVFGPAGLFLLDSKAWSTASPRSRQTDPSSRHATTKTARGTGRGCRGACGVPLQAPAQGSERCADAD